MESTHPLEGRRPLLFALELARKKSLIYRECSLIFLLPPERKQPTNCYSESGRGRKTVWIISSGIRRDWGK